MIKKLNLTKKIFCLFILLLTITACGGGSSGETGATITPVQATLTETIDTYLASNLSDNQPGVSVLVRKGGTMVYQNSKGLANNHTQAPLSSETGYRLASVSKLFTAIAIMQLVEQQQLQLDNSVRQYLPELPASWQAITLDHLLSHQSGIPDYANDFSGDEQQWVRGMDNQDLIEHYASNDSLKFSPGSQGSYSNSGYVLLAQVISRVSGLEFAAYIEANIFAAAGMVDSYIVNKQQPLKADSALNYGQSSMPFDFELYLSGAAGQVSSIDDMNNFVAALLNQQLISQASIDLMQQAHSDLPQIGIYGYSWRHGSGNVTSYDINGSNDGFQSLIIIAPTVELEVVILSNGGETTNSHKAKIFALINEFYNQQ